MSEFEDMLQADMENTFLADLGEDVTYTPLAPSPSNPVRTVRAIVMRDPPAPRGWNRQAIVPKVRITVTNKTYNSTDTVHGISSATVNYGGDKITVSVRKGETGRALTIMQPPPSDIESHDAGALNLVLG